MKSILTKKQTKIITKSNIREYGEKCDLIIEIRYDDECGNGHNSFAITAEVYKAGRRGDKNWLSGGCQHEIIEKHAPELKSYIKWHLTSSDGPMHYVANSMYHARSCTHTGKKPGDPVRFETSLKFKDIPFTFRQQVKGFWDYLDNVGDFNNIEVEAIPYDGTDNYDFGANYSLTGLIKENESKKWYKTPFKSKEEASEFLQALQNNKYSFIDTPTDWAKAVEPNLDAARNCAVWPEAKLKDFTEKKLKARLPKLIKEFKKAVENLEFIF